MQNFMLHVRIIMIIIIINYYNYHCLTCCVIITLSMKESGFPLQYIIHTLRDTVPVWFKLTVQQCLFVKTNTKSF